MGPLAAYFVTSAPILFGSAFLVPTRNGRTRFTKLEGFAAPGCQVGQQPTRRPAAQPVKLLALILVPSPGDPADVSPSDCSW